MKMGINITLFNVGIRGIVRYLTLTYSKLILYSSHITNLLFLAVKANIKQSGRGAVEII